MAADFASVGPRGYKKKLLILVDALTGYAEAIRFLCPPTSASVINLLSDFWHTHEWLSVFASDAELILVSRKFDLFLEKKGITCLLSSAGNPQSNGLSEKVVQSFKRLYNKKLDEDLPWKEAWALWKDSPQQPGQLSPTRLWFRRPLRHPGWFTATIDKRHTKTLSHVTLAM